MVILQSHRTQNMILRCYPNVSAILRRHTKSCLLCFFNNLPFLIHRIFNLLVSALFLHVLQYRREHSSRSFAPPKKWQYILYLVWSRDSWGINCAHAHVGARLGAEYSSCINFVVHTYRTCSKKTACLNFLCLFPMDIYRLEVTVPALRGSGATPSRLAS